MVNDPVRLQKQITAIEKYKWNYTVVLAELVQEVEILVELLQNLLKDTDITIIKLHGQLKTTELREQQQALAVARENKTSYLIVGTIDMMGRWEDIPELETIFLFAPVKFEGTVVQAIGRWLRALPGKWEVAVYDWLDLPLLKKQAKLREKSYKSEYTTDVLIDKIKL